MIYSPGRRYLFIHIPKTGGTAMALALEARAKADDMMAGDTPKAARRRHKLRGLPARGRLWKHSTLADLDGWLGAAELEPLFVFTLVRNPWDRIVSYYHWLRVQQFSHAAVSLARALRFDEFVAHPLIRASFRAAPYASYMRDAEGREHCDAWIRLEHLEADLAPLAAHLGFAPAPGIANRSDRQADYRGYYSDRTAAMVAEDCAEDIARFAYAFG